MKGFGHPMIRRPFTTATLLIVALLLVACNQPPPCTGNETFRSQMSSTGPFMVTLTTSAIGEITDSVVVWTDGGASSPVTTSKPTASHVYVNAGTYNARLTVRFICGGPTITHRWSVRVEANGVVTITPIR